MMRIGRWTHVSNTMPFFQQQQKGIKEVIVFDWRFSLKFSLVQATYFWFVVFIWNFIDKTLLLSTNLDVHDIKDA